MNPLALVLDPTVQAALVTSFGLIIVALLGLLAEAVRRTHNSLRSVKKDTRGTREQVENSHSTNLREDIDRLTSLVETSVDGQRQLMNRIDQLHEDATLERRERLAADQRIDTHIATVAVTAAQVADALRLRERQLDHNPEHNL